MLKLERRGPHEWEFVYPPMYREMMDEFYEGCERFSEGDFRRAERIFRQVLARMPDHLDALHHLAMLLDERGDRAGARALWEQAVQIGRGAFPKTFNPRRDLLEWGWLDNRPFLRCLHGLALTMFDDGRVEEALLLFQELLRLNPNDNQGIRGLAVEALFTLGRPEEVLKVCHAYPEDAMPETLYGRALALFQMGRREPATNAIRDAIRFLPLVAKELLKSKHRRPPSTFPGTVAWGGPDEAYNYWERQGKFWEDTPGALAWLKEVLRSKPSTASRVRRRPRSKP